MTFKAGLVGAGNIARFHVQALRRLPGVEIVGVTDRDAARAQQFAQAMSLPAHSTLAALRDAGASVIHIVTPPASHAAIAIEAMALGCDVYIEKPMATSVEDCERIESAARQYDRRVCVGHSLLFDPFVRRAIALVESGAIGDVVTFDYFRSMNQAGYAAAAVSADQQRGGYPFRDIGIHALYLAEAFVGPIVDVQAWPIASGRGDCTLWVDDWRALARGARATAQLQLSWNVRPQQNLFVVQGTRGIIRADLFGLSVVLKKQGSLPEPATRLVNALREGAGTLMQTAGNVARVATKKIWQFHGVQALVMAFYDSLARNAPMPVTAADATRVVGWTEHVARQADEAKDRWAAGLTARRVGARTLVTGGGGFIGRHLVRRLIGQGTAVRVLARRPLPADLATHPLIELVLGDLGDAHAVKEAVAGIDLVYHVGAAMKGSTNEFERGTIAGTRNIVESCLAHRVGRLVYMSSLAVIDTDAGRGGSITETSALEQKPEDRGNYTRTKLEAEAIVLEAVRQRGLNAVLLRPGEVVGPEKPLLTPGVAQQVASSLVVLGSGRTRLPLVHVSDVVDALLAASAASVESGAVIHLVEDTAITQNDIIAHYLQTTGERRRVIHLPLGLLMPLAAVIETIGKKVLGWAPIGPRRLRAATSPRHFDCALAARVLGWAPRVGVRAAFASGQAAVPDAPTPDVPKSQDRVAVA